MIITPLKNCLRLTTNVGWYQRRRDLAGIYNCCFLNNSEATCNIWTLWQFHYLQMFLLLHWISWHYCSLKRPTFFAYLMYISYQYLWRQWPVKKKYICRLFWYNVQSANTKCNKNLRISGNKISFIWEHELGKNLPIAQFYIIPQVECISFY